MQLLWDMNNDGTPSNHKTINIHIPFEKLVNIDDDTYDNILQQIEEQYPQILLTLLNLQDKLKQHFQDHLKIGNISWVSSPNLEDIEADWLSESTSKIFRSTSFDNRLYVEHHKEPYDKISEARQIKTFDFIKVLSSNDLLFIHHDTHDGILWGQILKVELGERGLKPAEKGEWANFLISYKYSHVPLEKDVVVVEEYFQVVWVDMHIEPKSNQKIYVLYMKIISDDLTELACVQTIVAHNHEILSPKIIINGNGMKQDGDDFDGENQQTLSDYSSISVEYSLLSDKPNRRLIYLDDKDFPFSLNDSFKNEDI